MNHENNKSKMFQILWQKHLRELCTYQYCTLCTVQCTYSSSTKSKPYSKKLYHELGELQWVKIMKEKTGGEGDTGTGVLHYLVKPAKLYKKQSTKIVDLNFCALFEYA